MIYDPRLFRRGSLYRFEIRFGIMPKLISKGAGTLVINGSHSAGPEIGHYIQSAFLLPYAVFANVTKLVIADLGVRLVI